MEATKKLDDREFNDVIPTAEIMPCFEKLCGESVEYVGKSYHFITKTGLLQSINLYAKNFDPEKYESLK